MKKYFILAAAALVFAACTSDEIVPVQQVQETIDDGAVRFDAYVNRGLTRAGVNGPIDNTSDLQTGTPGFGVFGYYTDGEPYSGITKPNFFYNQNVTYSTDHWTYAPVKYWPNEFGGDAKSDQVDRVTLFAYAPWVDVDPLTGAVKDKPTTNITGMTRNTATGDPFIKYSASMDPTNSVDLCYGVAAEDFVSSNSAINRNAIAKGKPYIDVVKPGTDVNSKIKFDFKHATAQLKVTINADVKDMNTGATDVETTSTRIWVRSVTFTGVTQKGALNLNSTASEPEWYDVNGNSKITTGSITVYDGRKDDKEANDGASNETPATLNPNIVQDAQYTVTEGTNTITAPSKKGVTATTQDLLGSGSDKPVFVIPTKEKMRVTIVYDVETVDRNLPYYLSDGKTPGSTIQNTIYKDIDTFGDITAGYCYTLNLHLGMRTVDFDAKVTPWQEMAADVNLPSNLQTFIANAPQTNATVNLGCSATEYAFAVSDLIAGTSIIPNASGTIASLSYTNPVPVNGSGVGECRVPGITPNVTPHVVPLGTIRLYDGNKAAQLTINQMASPLGLTPSALAPAGTTITLTASTATGTITGDWTAGSVQKVMKGGTDIKASCSISGSGNVGTLTIPAAAAGDNYAITIKIGDAPAETVTVSVPVTP